MTKIYLSTVLLQICLQVFGQGSEPNPSFLQYFTLGLVAALQVSTSPHQKPKSTHGTPFFNRQPL